MKVRTAACEGVLRGMLRRAPGIWLIALASISIAQLLSGVGLICWGDAVSVLMLVSVSLGVIQTNLLPDNVRSPGRAEESTQAVLERTLLAHLTAVVRGGLSILNAKHVALTLRDKRTGRLLDWNLQHPEKFSALELARAEANARPRRPEVDAAVYLRHGRSMVCAGLSGQGQPIRRERLLEHLRASGYRSFETLMLSYFEAGQRWQGTVAYIDAPAPSSMSTELKKLQQVVGMATSAVNLYQTVCGSARTEERRRLARDLHDGVIQSLIATELQVALMKRENGLTMSRDNEVLNRVQELLRGETRKLRRQMEELQSAESPASIQRAFETLMDEFGRDTGIAASFDCEVRDEALPALLTADLLYLLQEALSNVSRHSGAKRVRVWLEIGRRVNLEVEDDGRGFDFCGRHGLPDLRSMRGRPRTICERVDANGGELIIESSPGSGARIEISLPIPSICEERNDRPYLVSGSQRGAAQQVPGKKAPRSTESVRRIRAAP